MNLRKLIVKGLYPLCSEEVRILLDQMKEHPEKFEDIFGRHIYSDSPWTRVISDGGFELIDHVALRQQLKLLKTAHAKQLILQGLIESKEMERNRESNLGALSAIQGFGSAPVKAEGKPITLGGASGTAPSWTTNTTAPNTIVTTKAMQQAAKDLLKAKVDAQFKKDYATYKAKNRYAK